MATLKTRPSELAERGFFNKNGSYGCYVIVTDPLELAVAQELGYGDKINICNLPRSMADHILNEINATTAKRKDKEKRKGASLRLKLQSEAQGS